MGISIRGGERDGKRQATLEWAAALFFPVLSYSHHYPSRGPYFLKVTSYLGLSIHPSQLLRRRLSLSADDVSTSC